MARLEDPVARPPRWRSVRLLLARAAIVYLVLGCLGLGILISFVPDFFNIGELSPYRLLVLVAVAIFLVGPVVALGYFALEAAVESVVRGAGWALETCFRAPVRFVKKLRAAPRSRQR